MTSLQYECTSLQYEWKGLGNLLDQPPESESMSQINSNVKLHKMFLAARRSELLESNTERNGRRGCFLLLFTVSLGALGETLQPDASTSSCAQN